MKSSQKKMKKWIQKHLMLSLRPKEGIKIPSLFRLFNNPFTFMIKKKPKSGKDLNKKQTLGMLAPNPPKSQEENRIIIVEN
jgi:hypothetical protein